MCGYGSPPPRIVLERVDDIMIIGCEFLPPFSGFTGSSHSRGWQGDADRELAGGDEAPQRDEQLAR